VFALVSGLAAQNATSQGSDPDTTTPATVTQLPAASAQAAPSSFDQVIDRVVEREHFFVAQMRHMHPLIETYIQNMKPDKEMGTIPVGDHYFLGRLDMSNGTDDRSFVGRPGFGRRMLNSLTSVYSMHFLPLGFAQMVMLDDDFQKKAYTLTFVRREFLGETRCLVIDVHLKTPPAGGLLGPHLVKIKNSTSFALTALIPTRQHRALPALRQLATEYAAGWLPAYVYSRNRPEVPHVPEPALQGADSSVGLRPEESGRTDEFRSTRSIRKPSAIRGGRQDATL
jgi:hypothetical protein